MVNLEKLALYNQRISDLAPLKDLHYLSYLGLGSNDISEMTAITSIKSLNYLDLSGNPIMNDDLKQLKELSYLWGLDLGATKVTSLYEIKELKLYFLSLFECKVGDCIGLDEITTLDNLILTGVNNAITDRAIDRVSKLTNLKILKIFGSDRIDLSKLSTLKSLYLLDLCGMWNNSNLGDLTNPNLTQLYIVYWQILDLTGIEKLTCIEQIHLRDSKCSDYTLLLSVKTLKTVYCNQEQQKIIKEQLGEVPFEVLIE
jgi:internalin A